MIKTKSMYNQINTESFKWNYLRSLMGLFLPVESDFYVHRISKLVFLSAKYRFLSYDLTFSICTQKVTVLKIPRLHIFPRDVFPCEILTLFLILWQNSILGDLWHKKQSMLTTDQQGLLISYLVKALEMRIFLLTGEQLLVKRLNVASQLQRSPLELLRPHLAYFSEGLVFRWDWVLLPSRRSRNEYESMTSMNNTFIFLFA